MEKDILDVELLDDSSISLVPAAAGKRFANYLVDIIIFYGFTYLLAILLISAIPDAIASLNDVVLNLYSIILYVLFYTVLESSTKGKTIGKYLTKTRVVNIDGTAPSFKTCLLRSLSRLVPFEPFSFLFLSGIGWHDTWTDTYVVDEKQSVLPQSEFSI